MNLTNWKTRLLMFLFVVSIMLGSAVVSMAQTSPPLANPVLYFLGQELYQASGKSYIRYRFAVLNSDIYPNALFAASPQLPPCGLNTRAARTWVDLYDQTGKRLNGFCALGGNQDLSKIWFALEEGVIPPSWIYIELNDRQTQTKYKSNLSDTVM